jgi:hypothetical protein
MTVVVRLDRAIQYARASVKDREALECRANRFARVVTGNDRVAQRLMLRDVPKVRAPRSGDKLWTAPSAAVITLWSIIAGKPAGSPNWNALAGRRLQAIWSA